MHSTILHTTDLERDFVTRYFISIGDFDFLNNSSDLIEEFTSDLRDHIEFDPEDDDDDDDDEDDDSDSDGEEDTDADGFNVGRFLEAILSKFEEAAVEQFAQQSDETGQCIRQVIEVNYQTTN